MRDRVLNMNNAIMNKPPICVASAVAPGLALEESLGFVATASDPFWGELSLEHVQLCPQHSTVLNEVVVDRCSEILPKTQFRLHASVRVSGVGDHRIWDASNAHKEDAQPYWRRLAELSRYLGAGVYSMHAGRRHNGPLEQVFANVRELEQRMGLVVALEGLYPDEKAHWHVSHWEDYARLLNEQIPFALDLSHLNIVAHRTGKIECALVREMLSSPWCVEVHVSGNSGDEDSHFVINKNPWWIEYLGDFNPDAVVFTEAKLSKPRFLGGKEKN